MTVAVLFFIVFVFSSIKCISTTTYTCDPNISCGCSALSTIITSRIVDGEAAPNNAWGWIVSFQRLGMHKCGASLLTPQYAVTAAHCVQDYLINLSVLSILAGTNYLNDASNTTAQRRTIIKIVSHPNYNPVNYTNDIAILQFSPLTISSNSNIAFICLPSANQDPFRTGTDLVAIGWGVTSQDSDIVSNYLQQVTVQVISYTSADCHESGISNSNVQFCAGVSGGGKGKLFL
jgi:secreted trypsin-like serine protease